MQTAALQRSEIYVQGNWVSVPALKVHDKTIVVSGRALRTAFVQSEEWLETELLDPEECVRQIREQQHLGRVDIFTFTQKPSNTEPKYSYHMERESVAGIKLTSFNEWWEALPQATRKNVRRAEKRGVRVEVRPYTDEVVAGIVKINNESPMRQGIRNVQFGKSFEQVRKDHASFAERSAFICAFCEDEFVGLLKLVFRGEVASILNLLPSALHEDKRPANAMIAKAVEICASRGISCVTYGLFNYGNKQDSPLREFKIRNGFGEILVPRYFVPMSGWGILAMKLKLHRGPLGLLPPWAISMGIAVRNKLQRVSS